MNKPVPNHPESPLSLTTCPPTKARSKQSSQQRAGPTHTDLGSNPALRWKSYHQLLPCLPPVCCENERVSVCKAMVLHRRDLAANRHTCGCHTGQKGPLGPTMHGTAPAQQPGLGRQQRGVEKSGGRGAMPGSGLSARRLLCFGRVPTAPQHDTAVCALQSRQGSDRMQPALVAEGRAEQKGFPIS